MENGSRDAFVFAWWLLSRLTGEGERNAPRPRGCEDGGFVITIFYGRKNRRLGKKDLQGRHDDLRFRRIVVIHTLSHGTCYVGDKWVGFPVVAKQMLRAVVGVDFGGGPWFSFFSSKKRVGRECEDEGK
jgi:hypothetical protein